MTKYAEPTNPADQGTHNVCVVRNDSTPIYGQAEGARSAAAKALEWMDTDILANRDGSNPGVAVFITNLRTGAVRVFIGATFRAELALIANG